MNPLHVLPRTSLAHQRSPVADAEYQRARLAQLAGAGAFDDALRCDGQYPLKATKIQVLQLNLGRLCNQTCAHCHVDAGPDRREVMSHEVADACLAALTQSDIPLVDLTGGAPEMTPVFRQLVQAIRAAGRRVIDRCNLTILSAPGFTDLPTFLADHQVDIVASLPCYLAENTDRQRGNGVFSKSIQALRKLNDLGYGQAGSSLSLTLVFNPQGPTLPPDQASLEQAYRRELADRYGIVFTRLVTITNMPISRFLAELIARGEEHRYQQLLMRSFNPVAVSSTMCRTMISVDWQGRLYDCDFNQMLDLPVRSDCPRTIWELDWRHLQDRQIVTGPHCFGCTAGSGSSCQGALVGPSVP